jgi:hypothetical protein
MDFLLNVLFIAFIFGTVVSGNILGDMRNKSSGVVFFMWKGIQVFRKYVGTIANPRSNEQVAQRNRFKQCLEIGQNILVPILHVYWKRFAIKKSEINAFMSKNMKDFIGPLLPADLTFLKGQKYIPAIECSTHKMDEVVVDALGAGFIDAVVYTKICCAWVNVKTGQVMLPAKQELVLAQTNEFDNTLDIRTWMPEDVAIFIWIEKPVLVTANDWTTAQFIVPTG